MTLARAILSTLASALVFAGCSSSGPILAADQAGALRCCFGGVAHRCGNVAAQDHCNAGIDTLDCAKTAEICGVGPADAAATNDPPDGSRTPIDAQIPAEAAAPIDVAKKTVGALCADSSECEGELCLTGGGGSAGFCSKTCAVSRDCPSGFRCDYLEKLGIRACIQIGEKRLGEPCIGGEECESGICTGVDGSRFCSKGCASAAECPAGWSCVTISSGMKRCVQ
jgi:hypothetical protein